jgi:hypothetical protein
MKLLGGILLFLALSISTAYANPVWYYIYENPVSPSNLKKYGPAGQAGDNIVCVRRGDQQMCGIKADLVITLDPGQNAHAPNVEFVDWRSCLNYSRILARNNDGGFYFFCYGTDGKAFW